MTKNSARLHAICLGSALLGLSSVAIGAGRDAARICAGGDAGAELGDDAERGNLPDPVIVNFREPQVAGRIRANNAIVSLGASGDFVVFCEQGSGTTDLIIDISGYFQ